MEMYSDDDSDYNSPHDENVRLLMSGGSQSKASSIFEKYKKSSETVFDVRNLQNSFDDKLLENDTDFVVNAINESHESLMKLVSK